jgi:SAM-dependent methyltransferase
MTAHSSIEEALGIDELRGALLEHSRRAYALLPSFDRPRILDIGCGSGLPTIELARLSGGTVVGIDIDESALARLRQRIREARLASQVTAVNVSLYDTGFPDDCFEIIWDEGVLHTLDLSRSLRECHRLLKAGGILAVGETACWFETVRDRIGAFGFRLLTEHLLPTHCWWTDYYARLETRIRVLRETHGDAFSSTDLARYEREVAMVKSDPGRFDCGFYLVQKIAPLPRGPGGSAGASLSATAAWVLFPLLTLRLMAVTFLMILTPMTRRL